MVNNIIKIKTFEKWSKSHELIKIKNASMKSEQEEVWFLCTYMVSHNRIDNKPQFFFFFFLTIEKHIFVCFWQLEAHYYNLDPKIYKHKFGAFYQTDGVQKE